MEYRYTVDQEGDYNDCLLTEVINEWDLTDEWDREYIAEQCAKDYHENHGGWEYLEGGDSIDITIWKSPTESYRYSVMLEFVPRFSAYSVK